jgi:peptidoglycan hydrolase-like protein with peptidoglycan-binding domain
VKVQKLAQEAKIDEVATAAQYDTVTREVKVADAKYDWRSILCETNATPTKIKDIQLALKAAGYEPGPIDGNIKQQTMRAVNQFQSAKNLPVDPYINIETVKALGIDPLK